jgi:UDP-N-acetylmuramate--alanine ligase
MSALARVLHSRGQAVTGSDSAASATLSALEGELGRRLAVGQSASNIGEPDVVVVSAAIKETNPEVVEARRRGIPIVSRAELLGEIMDLYTVRVAVSGTHGKTTTSAMAARMLECAGKDPTALIGSDVPEWRSNTLVGSSDIVVAEACEAYGSFLEMRPTHAIVTNIEADHLDYYANFNAIAAAFRQFVEQTSVQAIVCADGGAAGLVEQVAGSKLLTYGIESGSFTADPGSAGRFAVKRDGRTLGDVRLQTPGRHNVLNALSVVALGLSLGLSFREVAAGLAAFKGTSRRFEVLRDDSVTIIDDYAHHPSELRATLAAARAIYPDRRIVALFQPHLPSRTRDFIEDFAASFADADCVLLTDIYLAREEALPGVTAERLAAETARRRGAENVRYAGDLDGATELLRGLLRHGDVFLTLGAGSVRRAAEQLVAERFVPRAEAAIG